MGILSGCLVYLVLWWIVLFTVLPWKISAASEHGQGHDRGSPNHTHLKYKLLLTSVIAGLVWIAVYYAISLKLISLDVSST